jgi:hypothetical protein
MPKDHHNGPGSSGGKGPMRQWSAPSYSPDDGRSVSSVDEQGSREHVWQNNHTTGNAQLPSGEPGKGSPSWKAIDAQRCQNATPVHRRRIG